ncbi:MAG TPA: histidine kinase [Steroidobacteraceae bacterium]|nr:histidine kinase [Steroidobacteraceae bacterium]
MNTPAIELPATGPLYWPDRARALFNGIGYATALSIVMACLGAIVGLPDLLAGHVRSALHASLSAVGMDLIEVIPGPILITLAVNLAPRSGPSRVAWLLAAAVPMCLWCEYFEGISFGWNWSSVGALLEGVLETSLVVGVCAYHSYSRDAGDTLLRAQIDRAGLDTELQRAQLRLLHAQIEPHFLFNTLSAVRALARSDRAATLAMLDNVIRYFEAALPRLREDEVPLGREMQLVDAYLGIYQVRMGSRLSYRITLPEELAGVRIPAMMLLTLVENALKHGINPTLQGGSIGVCARRERDALLLEVTDSGRGLNARLGHGAGLANVRQRLLLLHGEDAVLSLRPALPSGVVASVRMPMRQPRPCLTR